MKCKRCGSTMEKVSKEEIRKVLGWKTMSDRPTDFWLCKSEKCGAWKSKVKNLKEEKEKK